MELTKYVTMDGNRVFSFDKKYSRQHPVLREMHKNESDMIKAIYHDAIHRNDGGRRQTHSIRVGQLPLGFVPNSRIPETTSATVSPELVDVSYSINELSESLMFSPRPEIDRPWNKEEMKLAEGRPTAETPGKILMMIPAQGGDQNGDITKDVSVIDLANESGDTDTMIGPSVSQLGVATPTHDSKDSETVEKETVCLRKEFTVQWAGGDKK